MVRNQSVVLTTTRKKVCLRHHRRDALSSEGSKYGPIACLNSVYKVITETLAKRNTASYHKSKERYRKEDEGSLTQ